MARGRQKAKQRRVARNLKYHTPDTDYAALERELVRGHHSDDEDDRYVDRYADYVDFEDDDEYNEDKPAWDPRDVPPATE
ncbi:DUF3073 domain-containing protein [Actinotignum urinale]|uniref:DUF3073 domain-containing protein n=1 Tax=Actinotignum urinale TaxID=190146 RepID=A0AAW9HKG0_9ACTO|nr:DUF3073 domain-containing protein [Actinotignum urinale]MDY5129314.1 DUF3073 domain-containing protein [Actinotignum urinale]MDY5151711.1 DUF3073 domain-containing protein [Actinotignum urinale]MDY5154400.1 DUF3073 domain-containing protein [Actinotignum urinale]MDY5160415.1 DUF3073 domain-containing protein [Actinotignum urinale]WIK59703.1 DUF3073 domain-containing protein [Actinotignum urinale]